MPIDLHITPLTTWFPEAGGLLVMGGPCSAENQQQVLQTAEAIAQTGKVQVFRAGIWKPRTRLNSFQGMGIAGLKWLQQVKRAFGLKIATEVGTVAHLEACLRHEVDMVWLGARTSVNPFAVQELANALRGVDLPVFVKNPIIPDLSAWIGALERINQAGITKIGAIYRGCFSMQAKPFRNAPMWHIPLALKKAFPGLPVLCDVSHMAGKRQFIQPAAEKAMDLAMAGLMIETHIQPQKALSDAQQQVTPENLDALLHTLVNRKMVLQNSTLGQDH